MAESKRKATRKQTPTTATPKPVVSNSDDVSTTLENAYRHALDERDRTTGTIPAEPLDAVKVAYLATPKRQRKPIVARLAAKASEVGANGGEHVDLSMGGAVMAMTALFAKLDEQDKPAPPPHDPVPGVAVLLDALDKLKASVLADLSDEQRERVPTVDLTTEEAQDKAKWFAENLDKLKARAVNGRGRRNGNGGTRSSVSETTKRLQDAVAESDKPLTFPEVSERTGVSTSTLWNRWNAISENPSSTPGVVADTVDGEKVFKAAD